MYEFAVAIRNPISRRWIYEEVTSQYKAEQKFDSLKALNIRCRLIRRKIAEWEIVEESEVKNA